MDTSPASSGSALATTLVSRPDHVGKVYFDALTDLHSFLQPRSYLEIGTNNGYSLERSRCPTIAVDPCFALADPGMVRGKRFCMLFEMTSDRFFADHSPTALFGGPVDLAFLDGLHLFEVLLRDFINTERHCERDSVIVLHDCAPTDNIMAERTDDAERRRAMGSDPGRWAGDVWKVVPILRQHRPDLVIRTFDAPPTGLVTITGLDPESEVLARDYWHIVREYAALELGAYGLDRLQEELALTATGDLSSFEVTMGYFAPKG